MAKPRILRLAERWTPDPNDPLGEDKRRLIRFLLENGITAMNPRPKQWMIEHCEFEHHCTREGFPHQLLGPPLFRSGQLPAVPGNDWNWNHVP
jgi:hypothetical protein